MVAAYKDFARSYLFRCTVMGPNLTSFYNDRFLVQSASLPKNTLETQEVMYQGQKFEIPTTQIFDNYSITFRSDPDQELRSRFLGWMNQIHNPATNVRTPINYYGEVQLTQLDGSNLPVMSYNLKYAFPKEVGEITLDYTNKDISTFTVNFAYIYHTQISRTFAGAFTDTQMVPSR